MAHVPALIAILVAAAAVAIWRAWYVARVEREDAARPRSGDGILRGAEPFTFERVGAPAVLLLHGGGDTPQTLRGLGEALFARGFAVRAPLLPGHGRSVRDWRNVDADAWGAMVRAAHDELRRRHPWVALVGLSLGGALAVLEAAERPDVSALVLLAPYLSLPRTLRVGVAASRIAGLISPYFSADDSRSVRDPVAAAHGLAYGVFTPAAARALQRTADAAFAALSRVQAPTLIVQSPDDNRVAATVAERAFRRLGCADKRLEWARGGGHVITVDFGHEQVFGRTAAWLESHGAYALLRP